MVHCEILALKYILKVLSKITQFKVKYDITVEFKIDFNNLYKCTQPGSRVRPSYIDN